MARQLKAPGVARSARSGRPNVVIATAVPPNPCAFPTADLINKLSVVNKQVRLRMVI